MNGTFDISVVVTQCVNQKEIRSQQHWLRPSSSNTGNSITPAQCFVLILPSCSVLKTPQWLRDTHLCQSVTLDCHFPNSSVCIWYFILARTISFKILYRVSKIEWETVNTLAMGIPSSSHPQALKKEISRNAMQRMYDFKWIFVPKKDDD